MIRSIDPPVSKYRLRIHRSRIHRVGVFAAEPIPQGRRVVEYTGERLNLPQFRVRYDEIWGPGGIKQLYLFRLNPRCFIDGAVGGCGAEFINHSCDPNLRVRKTRGHILFFSRRQIRPGEELTFDYRLNPDAIRIVCRCGSRNCRGTLYRK
ncbi:MAG: SET domain-containing protein-lysine N-methyltransferase [Candidatus Acidiferrales bacterium]